MSDTEITKIVITLPHRKGSEQFNETMALLSYMEEIFKLGTEIKVCDKCELCGAINDTVELVKLFDGIITDALNFNRPPDKQLDIHDEVLLCDACVEEYRER